MRSAIEAACGRSVRTLERVGGGDINLAYKVQFEDESFAFVKTRPDVPAGEYAAEAAGLRWLAEPGALRVPEVLGVTDDVLVLDWVDEGRRGDMAAFGAGLAEIHAAGADDWGATPGASDTGSAVEAPAPPAADAGSAGEAPAPPAADAGSAGEAPAPAAAAPAHRAAPRRPVLIGRLVLDNDPCLDWPTFYATRRLLPLLPEAGLSARGVRAVESVCDRIADLAGPPEPPARLHGDLWSGNVLWDRAGRAWLIDPAVYGGHREVDLAMLQLFANPARHFFSAYEDRHPLAPGWQDRVPLYQLFPLLVHAALFGGGYAASTERVASAF
jgi:fructosamine-3-kinase